MKRKSYLQPRGLVALLCAAMVLLNLFSLCSCGGKYKYDKEWILGKTSSEIEERYGEFDRKPRQGSIYEKDGNYYNAQAGYLLKEERVGYLGTDPAEYYMIWFDEYGQAVGVDEEWSDPKWWL